MNLNDLKFLNIKLKKHPTRELQMEYIEKPDAIGVMLVDEKMEKTLLVNQYRPGTDSHLLEIPAGIIEEGETALSTLGRELREETGYILENVEIIYESQTPLATSPGYTTEKLYLYIAKLKNNNIVPLKLMLDESEDLTTKWIDIKNMDKINTDIKTVLAYNMYMNKNKK